MHEKYPVCIMCGLESTECRNMGEQRALSQQCHPSPAGCPWEEAASPWQPLSPAPCQLPGLCWHTWGWDPSCPTPLTRPTQPLPSSQGAPGVLQHHIHHPQLQQPPPCSSPCSFCSIQGRSSRLLPSSVKCCHLPRCTQNAPREWHQDLCVQRGAGCQNHLQHCSHLKAP